MKTKNLFYLAGTLVGTTLLNTGCTDNTDSEQPNIIYILADDLGYGELGAYGQTKIETPNIDALSNNGIRFTQHYSGAAVSAPSRCVLLTGLHTGHSYIRGNDEMADRGEVWSHEAMFENPNLEGQRPLLAGTRTIATQLQDVGYATACIGKWGLGYPGSEGAPNEMGFDFFYGYNCQRQSHTYYPPFLWKNEERVYLDNKILAPGTKLDKTADPRDLESYAKYTQAEYAPDLMFDEITGFVAENKDDPFFLIWTTPVPHAPLQAPKEWVDYYVDKFGDEEPYIGDKGYFPCRYPRATYAAMVSYWDEQIGDLVAQLKELGVYENTLIIFTSDNGPTFNGGTDSPWFDSASPFKSERGWVKTSIREGGIRVPMIASWPAKIEPGQTSNHISAFWDVMPTFCEITGAEQPEQIDGISFLPTLLGKNQKDHEYLYWEYPEVGGSKALRMGKWKGYIPNIKKGNTIMELYDLEADPRESTDLASQYPEIVKEIQQKMDEAHEEPVIERFRM